VFLDLSYTGSSFCDLLTERFPFLLTKWEGLQFSPSEITPLPTGTTVLALKYQGGVIVVGDRQATEGTMISARRIEKVFKADERSAIAIAGVAGPCLELARLFQTELQHYEKLEGVELSTEGKANKLGQMVKMNFPMALQGLVVIPIFVSYDFKRAEGKIYKYDVTGGRYEETEYYATGSGGGHARATMKKRYRPEIDEEAAIHTALEALYDAAEEDIGTAGPDFVRGIFPTIKTVTVRGIVDVEETQVRAVCESMVENRRRNH
jgi:proteasome beta subunit